MAPRGHQAEPVTPGPRTLRTRPEPPLNPPAKTRRTSEQVKEDNLAKEKAKNAKKEARTTMIKKVAHLESSLVEEDLRMLQQAHHPPPNKQKKVLRPRPAPAPIERVNDVNDASTNNIAKASDSTPPSNRSENEHAMILTNSDDEDLDTAEGRSSIRSMVHATRHASLTAQPAADDIDSQEDGQLKRKSRASSDHATSVSAPSKKVKRRNGGLRPDWAHSASTPSEVQETTQLSIPVVAKINQDKESSKPASDDSDEDLPGGISDDESGGKAERARITEEAKPASLRVGTKVKSLAMVVDTRSVPEFVPGIPARVIKSRQLGSSVYGKKKADIRISDLKEP
ncbi:hypothetical protein H0H92_010883, partial [Tricholoma furcatifolium]